VLKKGRNGGWAKETICNPTPELQGGKGGAGLGLPDKGEDEEAGLQRKMGDQWGGCLVVGDERGKDSEESAYSTGGRLKTRASGKRGVEGGMGQKKAWFGGALKLRTARKGGRRGRQNSYGRRRSPAQNQAGQGKPRKADKSKKMPTGHQEEKTLFAS